MIDMCKNENLGLITVTGVSTLIIAIADLKPYIHLQLIPHITIHRQVRALSQAYDIDAEFAPKSALVMEAFDLSIRIHKFCRGPYGHHDILSL